MLVDTSGLLGALFPDQTRHEQCARALQAASRPPLLSPFVLAELDHLILRLAGVNAELALLGEVARGAYELATFSEGEVAEAREVVERYRDLQIGLADASIVVLARRHGVREVLTLDERHFRVIEIAPGEVLRVLPAVGA